MKRQAEAANPFLLFLSLGPPHFPYETAPAKYQTAFAAARIELRPNVPEDRREEATKILRGYYAHMAALDNCLDRLLQTLDRSGIADDTVVVFTSDHGDMMLSQGLTTKLYPWDESIRIPFLVRYPRKWGARSRRFDTPISLVDLMPTLLSLTGQAIPDGVQGKDRSALKEDAARSGTAESGSAHHGSTSLRLRGVPGIAHAHAYLRPLHQRPLAALRQRG